MKKTSVAILGSGKIACDLLAKTIKSNKLSCEMFSGKSHASEGIAYADKLGIKVSANSISAIADNINDYDIIFDATSALAHEEHQLKLKNYKKTIINLTPASTGIKCIPAVNLQSIKQGDTVNMISCGGQTAIPIIYSIAKSVKNIDYIEIVSSIASESAGIATRQNIPEYLENTENAISEFSNCHHTKAIININPAVPCINMKTTIYMGIKKYVPNIISENIYSMVQKVKKYTPHYQLAYQPIFENGRVTISVEVIGSGDYLPPYAGNLDIITSASVRVAEHIHEKIQYER